MVKLPEVTTRPSLSFPIGRILTLSPGTHNYALEAAAGGTLAPLAGVIGEWGGVSGRCTADSGTTPDGRLLSWSDAD